MAVTYKMPQGTVLAANQVWNAQHGYVSTDAKHCEKEALIAAYNAAGRPPMRTWIKDQAAKGTAVPSYPTCMAWFKAEDAAPSTRAVPVAQAHSTMTTLDEVEAAYKQGIKTLITKLEIEQTNLKEALSKVEDELAKAKEKLVKFD
ncbi:MULTISPECIES: hypothetical protein [unclassified Pseudomonas]|uniref:hypothetical protein n=1 Tax=unclassified Pseudomonas TaxID=196821 RepID=UPI000B880E46|nr:MULTISPECIES: hypothetical protein [unclassified Pseudomonas]